MNDLDTIDEIAMYGGGGLVLLGVVVIGFLEMLFGAPHPVGSDGAIEHGALVPLEIRSYVILLGLLIWMVYAVYKVATAGADKGASGTPNGAAEVD